MFQRILSLIGEGSQCLEVHHILGEVFSFWRFQHFRDFAESRAPHDEAESVQTDPAFANMLVSIYSRTQACLRIVYVNRDETIATDDAIKVMKCCPYS